MSNNPKTSPITSPNSKFRYGIWSGAGYSAGVSSPSFIPYSDEQKLVDPHDAFDGVSKIHDIDYEKAQTIFLANLSNGVPGSLAFHTYFRALAAADRKFVQDASAVTAITPWGETLRIAGIQAMTMLNENYTALADKILGDPSLVKGVRVDNL
jgi:hypothetical protein